MQEENISSQMATESEERKSPSQQVRSRMNTKPKVLVRSHAMREETSPPRAPTPTNDNIIYECNKLIPSPTTSPCLSPQNGKPVVVLSPSLSRGSSPCRTPTCSSPTSTLTLVPSPSSRCSSQNEGSLNATNRLQVEDSKCEQTRQDVEKDAARTEIIIQETSHSNKKKSDRFSCDCSNINCIKCLKGQERNFNNNLSSNLNNNILGSSNTLSVNRVNMRNKLRQHSSGQSSFDGSLNNSPCLSRDSSSEQYTDTTGIDLDLFFSETLNRNIKDRVFLLRVEEILVDFAKDKMKTHYKFPPMSSYQRMLVHRCAAYFGMDHNIESSGRCVVVNKTKSTRIPEVEFRQHIKGDFMFCEDQEPRRLILKRDSNSVEDYNFKSPDRQHSFESRRSKSFEEREEEYEKVRRRIFNRELRDSTSIEELGWSEIPWSSTESDSSSRFRLQLPNHNSYRQPGRLLKVQSEESNEALRPCVAKSYSFGGYGVGVLTRGDSVLSTHSAGPRLFTKQDSATSSLSWRLSPSSSGYKSQSQRSESVTPSPTSTPYLHNDGTKQDENVPEKQLVWAVTDIHSVPKGSIIINPQTGDPYKNEDGSIYHYDPMHPPADFSIDGLNKPPQSPQKVILSPKKSIKERPPSPKKRSPSKKSNFINSSTSPSLPYTPPPTQNRVNCHYVPSGDSIPQQYPIYSNSFGSVPQQDASVPYFQSPCVVYAPYSVPVTPHYEGRLETPIPAEVPPPGSFYVNIPDGGSLNPQPVAYQPPTTYWNQPPVTYYQNAPAPTNSLPPSHHRFPFPTVGQPGFIPTAYQSNFIPHSNQTTQNQELLPVYPQQPVQVVYPPTQPSQQTPVLYPNPGPLIYTQNPVYSNPAIYSSTPAMSQNMPLYPQSTSTPNSCSSSVSNNAYCRQVSEIPLQTVPVSSLNHIAQNMSQLNISGNSQLNLSAATASHQNYVQNQKQHYDNRQKNCTPKGGKYNNGKNFASCSSQNSTGTSSPATTVAAGYSGNNFTASVYRPSGETPPLHNVSMAYGHNYVQPVLCRQNSNMSTAGTNRSSRSPTPASDICNVDKQRISIPPALYQGMPYVFHVDNRMVDGRGQSNNNFKQTPARNQMYQGQEFNNFSRIHKNRKPRGNKPNGLPPSGKQCSM